MKRADMAVTPIDFMGSDLTVVNAARVSFNKESVPLFVDDNGAIRVDERDQKLIKYLATHNHWTPFGHCFAQFRIKAPIFVARQLVKHQVGLVWNEVSRRYVDDEPEFWFPDEWRSRPEGSMKQGSGSEVVEELVTGRLTDLYTQDVVDTALEAYNVLLKSNVAPEQARMILPQNMMTEWYWSGSLAAFARVCKLRLDPHAQVETRMIAEGIDAEMAKVFPYSWAALKET